MNADYFDAEIVCENRRNLRIYWQFKTQSAISVKSLTATARATAAGDIFSSFAP